VKPGATAGIGVLLALGGVLTARAGAAAAGARPAAPAVAMRVTGYDDGSACPGGCDAHVVFDDRHNGTRNAFAPGSSRDDPRPCRPGAACRICFAEAAASCTTVRYRGDGPAPGRFDFTPAFFRARCGAPDLPAALVRHCGELHRLEAELASRVDCFERPRHPRCRTVMEAAAARKAADEPRFAACRRAGNAAWNREHAGSPELQRSVECAYEKQATARGADGSRWPRLLDGACGPGRYVGRDGLDCCSGDRWEAAVTWPECDAYYPAP
jgi:hypothetical protein